MLGLGMYEASLCPGCGQPRDRAWHPAMEGWFEVGVLTCHACAARHKVEPKPWQRVVVRDSYDDPTFGNEPLGPPPKVTFLDPDDFEVEAAASPQPEGGELSA